MNKYRDKSDFEINKAVAVNINGTDAVLEKFGSIYISDGDRGAMVSFSPCNNPADAMPIIKDNLISLEHDGIAWQVSCVRHPEISVWDGCENYNDNFYRKAMELFLLMKDAENES
ncbi:TPA: phage protein NinX family protein [Morganella morganii]